MAKIIDWFPKIIFCKIPEIIMLMIPNAGIIKMDWEFLYRSEEDRKVLDFKKRRLDR